MANYSEMSESRLQAHKEHFETVWTVAANNLADAHVLINKWQPEAVNAKQHLDQIEYEMERRNEQNR